MRLRPNTSCGEMAQPALVKVLTALTVVLFVVLQTCEAQRQAVCYLTISHQESYLTYTRQSYTTYYRCGLFGWSRCRRTSYRQQSVTRYRTRYSSQSRCCSGYQSCSSRCCPTNSHTSLLTPTQSTVTPKASDLSLILSAHIKSSPTLQSSYNFVSTDMGPDATAAPLSSGPLLAGVLSVVGILCIAAMIIVIVLIVVIRGRRKTTRTLDNGSAENRATGSINILDNAAYGVNQTRSRIPERTECLLMDPLPAVPTDIPPVYESVN